MRLSTMIHAVALAPGWFGLYNPFGHRIAFLFEEAWDDLRADRFDQVSDRILDYLLTNHFLVVDDFEHKWCASQLKAAPRDVRLNSMYLVVTQTCNFACGYCAVMENLDSPLRRRERMCLQTGLAAVDLFQRHLEKTQPRDARVTFYGGEPMLNAELIAALVPRIKAVQYTNQTRAVEIVMITNGYLYDSDLAELFKQYGVGVCMSLDGTRRHQDVTRVTAGTAESTFDRVITNYRKYQQDGLSMGISTALGRHNVFDLEEICEFYATELRAPFVEFQIPYQVGNESNEFWISTAQAARFMMKAYTVLDSHGIIEATTYRRLRDFSSNRVRFRDCGASANQLVVAPDGSIGPCHSLVGSRAFFAGNVSDSTCDPAAMANFREWADRFPFNMPGCLDCAFISLCGGGCTYNSYVSTGTIWNKDPQVCTYVRELAEWIIRDLWQSSGMADRYGVAQTAASEPMRAEVEH